MTLALRCVRVTVHNFHEGSHGFNALLRQRQHQLLTYSCSSKTIKIRSYLSSSSDGDKKISESKIPKSIQDINNVPQMSAEQLISQKLQKPPKPPELLATQKTQENFSKTTESDMRTYSKPSLGTDMKSKMLSKAKLSPQAVRDNVKGYVFTRFFDYVRNYDKVLEKNFPSAVKVYRVFLEGVKYFYGDMKRYLKISRIVNGSPQGLKALNRQELELYMQMPRDMVKVAPAIIGSSLPMVGYVILPLVFMNPRKFLTSHFWSLQQRSEFQLLTLKQRISNNRSVFRCLQAKLKSASKQEHHAALSNILGLLGSGFHPHVDMLIDIKDIFASPPYSLTSLSGKHIKYLKDMHGLPSGWFKRHRLTEHAFVVHHMDLAIKREGGVHNMHPDAIRYSCFIRGLNPTNLSNEEMIEWLRNWIKVSTSIQAQHISLYLHLPLFMTYNHPNNWHLIYGNKKLKQISGPPSEKS